MEPKRYLHITLRSQVWNDQVESFRSQNMKYCQDCDALVEGGCALQMDGETCAPLWLLISPVRPTLATHPLLTCPGYDHVCPWTGTAIGRANIHCFYCFLTFITVLMYFACFVLVYGLVLAAK